MKGRRVYELEPHEMSAGDYGQFKRDANNWYASTPNGETANLSAHSVTEHEDGTITVSPSILVSTRGLELWHGYLERGVWRSV